MHVDLPLVEQLVTDVCSNMLGLSVSPDHQSGQSHANDWIATIHISGDWDALVEMQFTEAAAAQFAATMFGKSADELSSEEVRDAVGEVVNMLGGNLKGMVNGESNLSLPCVGMQTQKSLCPNYERLISGQFCCESHPFRISILQSQCELVGAAG
ncbi:MAG: chemotaxis protein CheX [Planctomycetaceae bacterium]